MSTTPATAAILDFQAPERATSQPLPVAPLRGVLAAVNEDGSLLVRTGDGRELRCDWLEAPTTAGIRLDPGDRVLVVLPAGAGPGVVLGRIGRYREAKPEPRVTIEATDTLSLKCGESSVDLRADGKVMVRGEDVLLRSKGQHRIKAGTVAIN